MAVVRMMLLAQAGTTQQTLLTGWTEADSIVSVMAILSAVLFGISFYLLKQLMKKNESDQKLILDLQKTHDEQTKELQAFVNKYAMDSVKAMSGFEHSIDTLSRTLTGVERTLEGIAPILHDHRGSKE